MAEPSSEIFFAGIAELNRMVRAKELSAVELARAFGRRLEAIGPRYNALALPLTEHAIRQAKAAQAAERSAELSRAHEAVPLTEPPTAWHSRPGGMLGAAELGWDAIHGVPLRFAIYANGSSSPVIELATDKLDYLTDLVDRLDLFKQIEKYL